MLIGELKEFTDYSRNSIRVIKLKLPTKYVEVDKENNIYLSLYNLLWILNKGSDFSDILGVVYPLRVHQAPML